MKDDVKEKNPGTMVQFWCQAEGKPMPKVTWTRNKRKFDVTKLSGVKIEENGQRLVFHRLVEHDSGFYECLVENRGGKLIRSVSLKVVGGKRLKSLLKIAF